MYIIAHQVLGHVLNQLLSQMSHQLTILMFLEMGSESYYPEKSEAVVLNVKSKVKITNITFLNQISPIEIVKQSVSFLLKVSAPVT